MENTRAIEILDNAADVIVQLEAQLKRAKDLLREWRDKYGGKEYHATVAVGRLASASPTDLIRETQRLLEGR